MDDAHLELLFPPSPPTAPPAPLPAESVEEAAENEVPPPPAAVDEQVPPAPAVIPPPLIRDPEFMVDEPAAGAGDINDPPAAHAADGGERRRERRGRRRARTRSRSRSRSRTPPRRRRSVYVFSKILLQIILKGRTFRFLQYDVTIVGEKAT